VLCGFPCRSPREVRPLSHLGRVLLGDGGEKEIRKKQKIGNIR